MNLSSDFAQRAHPPAWGAVAPAYGLALAVLLLDGATKQLTRLGLNLGDSIPLTPFFNYVHLRNTGAAFSLMADSGGWQRWALAAFAAVVAAVLAWWLRREPAAQLRRAYALLAGGAIGNGLERAIRGYVTDFLDFHASGMHWPAFNLADMAICAAVALIIRNEFAAGKHHG